MSTLADKLTMCADGTEAPLYVDDVFSTYLYTGNGSTQTINNGIDLAGNGGMVWIKNRTNANEHVLTDTITGAGKKLMTNSTGAQVTTAESVEIFTSSGFSLNTAGSAVNGSFPYASWTFRKAPRFFDVVTYTGNGVAGRQIAHSLGQEVGMIIVKSISRTGDWYVWRKAGDTWTYGYGKLNTMDAWVNTGADDAVFQQAYGNNTNAFTLGAGTGLNATNQNGVTYIAYLFAHDTEDDGIIQCGSYTGNGSTTGPIITLGWEPQWILVKRSSASGTNWYVVDNMRGVATFASNGDALLQANMSSAEITTNPGGTYIWFTPTGFQIRSTDGEVNSNTHTYIYLAIRRPNKPPESGTEVYQVATWTGNGTKNKAVQSLVTPVDLAIMTSRTTAVNNSPMWSDRLRGSGTGENSGTMRTLKSSETVEESNGSMNGYYLTFDFMDGITLRGSVAICYNGGSATYVLHSFRRAHGFFDIVAYTGTGVARVVNHNLGVAPELMIVKNRSNAKPWTVFYGINTDYLFLNNTSGTQSNTTYWNNTSPTVDLFTVGIDSNMNGTGMTYVAYLFATLDGISKVGSYTGNGSSQTIDCGFAAGARFILIKRTDNTGDWYIWDSVRGIVAGNDPHVSLNNTTAVEITSDDSIDPASSGFIVNQVAATNINVLNGNYIFLAIA